MKKSKFKKAAAIALSAGILAAPFAPFAAEAPFAGLLKAYAEESGSQIIGNDASGIPDKALYDAVLKAGDSNNDGVLTKEEAEKITYLNVQASNVIDITGIQYMKNLDSLILLNNKIKDISALKQLTNLKNLNLNINQINDITVLKYMENLSVLSLDVNQISDISALKDLINLKSLSLDSNQISDISVLKNLTNMETIRLDYNQISDISALANMTNMKSLYLAHNKIRDISEIKTLVKMKVINLDNNQISDISALENMTNMERLYLAYNNISDISTIEGMIKLTDLHLNNNQISNISPVKDMTDIKRLYLSDNQISDISMLKDLTSLTQLNLGGNQISDISALKDFTRLQSLDLSNNQISDISALKDLKILMTVLSLNDNQISDISVLKDFAKLHVLNLSDNQISDISVLNDKTNISALYLENNQISDITPIRDLELFKLDITKNDISDISALKDGKLLAYIEGQAGRYTGYMSGGGICKNYNMAEGNKITLQQALDILPQALLQVKEYDSEGNETGRTWLDTQEFITSNTDGVVVSKDGTIHYYVNGVENTTYTGMAEDSTTGKKYWFENGTAVKEKQVYSEQDNAWYWLEADGSMAVGKDVFVPKSNEDRSEGKWVRYDENGHMVKGEDYANGGWYRFDEITGEMVKGFCNVQDGDNTKIYYYNTVTGQMEHGAMNIDGTEYAFDDVTGVAVNNAWYSVDEAPFWYENGVRQGMEGRGKEIYDPASDGWYWLDAVDGGKKAVSKDVYQESYAGAYADREDGTGKWVRYDANGRMIKGWSEQNGSRYYFDLITGAMAKGTTVIDGQTYTFSWATGALQE